MSDKPKQLRCAIYTRKSSDEGLTQEFNSLDAQREACEAYVLSQKPEGWTLIPERYDDGGWSGGTLERPALQRLLADIEAGLIDVIVIYKVDRLTRSLSDFARLVELLDRHGVSFSSVTQQIHTGTSTGRLMLNMLLSFAQFEREVTGERIRDKIAASKKKGMWTGGNVPLGYRVEERALVVDEAEAETVRTIFQLYLDLESVPRVEEALRARGLATNRRANGNGRSVGGRPFSRGHLYKLLSNPIYIGQITHKGEIHKGQHEAIIDRATWNAVEEQLAANTRGRRTRANIRDASLLAGLLVDGKDRQLCPTHAVKGGRRYRYYAAEGDPSPFRIAAGEIEPAVTSQVAAFLGRTGALIDELGAGDLQPETLKALMAGAESLAEELASGGSAARREILLDLVERVTLAEDSITIHLKRQPLAARLLGEAAPEPEGTIAIETPLRIARRGVETKLVIEADGAAADDREPDPALVKAVARGHAWFEDLVSGRAESISAIARREGVTPRYVSRLLELAFLPPQLVEAILEGRQPAEMTAETLTRTERGLVWTHG